MNAQRQQLDDLTMIKGIGTTRQEWLRRSFQIHTYADLAALTPAVLLAQLRAEGRSATLNDIQHWLDQAQALAAAPLQADNQQAAIHPGVGTVSPDSASQAESWQRLAAFTVEFRQQITGDQPVAYQTAVHHMEANSDAIWPGIESKASCAWILEQLRSQQQPAATVDNLPGPLSSVIPSTPPVAITITQVCILQPLGAPQPTVVGEPGRVFKSSVSSTEPFALEVTFQLSEPVAAINERPLTYSAQFFVRNLLNNSKHALGATVPIPLVVGQVTYSAGLPAVALASGIYQMQVLVSLQNSRPSVGYLEIPTLQVV